MGGGQAGFLPKCCAPISTGRVINTVVTRSLQHIVFLLHQEKKTASPHFLQTVNLLVYSIPNLRELNIFFRHKCHTGLSPVCVNTVAKQQKDQISMLTRRVSHRGWGHNIRGTNCPLYRKRPVGCKVKYPALR